MTNRPSTATERTASRQALRPPLRRSRNDRMLLGVCGGVARSLRVDPALVRMLAVLLLLAGVGAPAYLVAWLLVPEADATEARVPLTVDARVRHRAAVVLGTALLMSGLFLLLHGQPWFQLHVLWRALVAPAGMALFFAARSLAARHR